MRLPSAVTGMLARFDALSMRERVLVAAAVLVGVFMLWVVAFLDPTTARQQALNGELSSLQESMQAAARSLADDPALLARQQEAKLKAELQAVNAELASASAGLIPPERMVQVIHDVLSRQQAVKLISLHNAPVTTLVPARADAPAEASADASGPYVHPVEIVVEGRYLDVLDYLEELEALPWRFYWRVLELKTTEYPVNHIRIELSTLSLDKDWIGV